MSIYESYIFNILNNILNVYIENNAELITNY